MKQVGNVIKQRKACLKYEQKFTLQRVEEYLNFAVFFDQYGKHVDG